MGFLRVFRLLYVQVLVGIALGIAVGALWPDVGVALKPLGDGFIKLIKMAVAPVIFCTVAAGIARMSDIKAFGRLGAKTLLYFEVVSTLALVIGLVVGNLVRSGVQCRPCHPRSQRHRRLRRQGGPWPESGRIRAGPDP